MEGEIDLRRYVEVLICYWKWIVGATLVAAAAALVVSVLIPPTYEAMALVAITEPRYVMRFDPRFETVDSVQPPYRAYPELATSDSLLQDLLTRLNSSSGSAASLQDMRGMVQARPGEDPSVIQLVARSRSPEEAAQVANAWADLFVARANAVYGGQSEEQAHFFEMQLERARTELEAAEEALVAFQASNQRAILEAQLASAQQDLQDYLGEQREIERAVRDAQALRTRVAAQPADAPVVPADDLAALLMQIQTFSIRTSRPVRASSFDTEEREELDGLSSIQLSTFYQADLESEPVVHMQVSDATLLSTERTAGELANFLDNLVAILEAKQEEVRARTAALEPRILDLQQQLQEAKVDEDSLVLARDVAQETYVTLARKLEEARIAAEDTSGKVQLASRAVIPESPAGPRKALNVAVAGALGLMLSVLAVFTVEWWRQGGEASELDTGVSRS